MRWNKMPKSGLQLRMTMVFVTIASLAAIFQVFLINRAMIGVARKLPNDGEALLEHLPTLFSTSVMWTGLVLIPVLLLVGILMTFRVAGPVFRIERYLNDVADGKDVGQCTIRGRDELHSLCDAVNRAVTTLQSQNADSTKSDSRPNVDDAPSLHTENESAVEEPVHGNSGFAIITALITVVILSATIIAAVTQFTSHSSQVEKRGEDYELESAVESATNFAMHELWSMYRRTVSAGTYEDSVDGFQRYLDSIGATDQSTATTPVGYNLGSRVGLDFDSDGDLELAGVDIEEIQLMRRDTAGGTELDLTVSVGGRDRRVASNAAGWMRTIETTFVIEPETWGGLNFVLLANNVNCALCHTTIDSTDRVYAHGPGPFERVKVGTLDQLMMRGNAHSQINGTLYAGGPVTDKNGVPITDWSSSTLRGVELDADGNVVEDSSGDPVSRQMSPTDGSLDQYGNLYEDYNSTTMIDGDLPSSFPPPFPDDGGLDPTTDAATTAGAGDRAVDSNEFYAVTKDFTGTLSGGRIYVVPPTDQILTDADRGVAVSGSNATSLSSVTEGQVFLTGTTSNPILLNGDVAVEGNLVIRGWVKGKGTIWVKDNIWAPTDIEYLDGTSSGNRTFGQASDGTENLLVLTAGGNIMLGDVYQPYRAGTSREGDKPPFTHMEMSTFNRAEWVKTQPQLPGSRTMFDNPLYEPGYVPRYYAETSGEPVGIFNRGGGWFDSDGTWRGAEHPNSWTTSLMTFADPSDTSDPLLFDSSGNPKAHVTYMTSANTWISDSQLEALMDDFYASRPSGMLKYDLFAYTNNAIFGITSSMVRNTNAQLRVNGGVVAADVGLLATAGIQLNYDSRILNVLRISGNERAVVRRTSSSIVR